MYATVRKQGNNMSDFSALDTVVREKAASKGDKKHYIPFTHEEFEELRMQFGKPTWMPADFKLVLQAIGEGRVVLAKPMSKVA
jgi:hypothetical protein